jgi:uncharacterized metal-binding protein
VLACSGGSNVGQITNEVAKRLTIAGDAEFLCLAGVGGHVPGMVLSVRGGDKVLALDGCVIACARTCLEAADIADFEHVCVTDLGIEKRPGFEMHNADLERVLACCREKLGARTAR